MDNRGTQLLETDRLLLRIYARWCGSDVSKLGIRYGSYFAKCPYCGNVMNGDKETP